MDKKEFVFEEVDLQEKKRIRAGVIDKPFRVEHNRSIRTWLVGLLVLIVIMIIVGGLTRLTDSGLSITEWKPITGVLPPISTEMWELAFSKYQKIPEYTFQNIEMTLSDFKVIYYWEWGHRQLGRLIGLVWLLGFIWFFSRNIFSKSLQNKSLAIGILLIVQGTIGWWMVSSGLSGRVLDVFSYRLGIHLTLAFIILGFIYWNILRLAVLDSHLIHSKRNSDKKLKTFISGILHLTFLQIFLGALVAGTDAGSTYTDWPLMAGEIFPSLAFELYPTWSNFFESQALVQFNHRIIGYLLVVASFLLWIKSRKSGNISLKYSCNLVSTAIIFQMILGITTLLYAAPWYLAILHQFGAIVTLLVILHCRFKIMYPFNQSVRTT
ncbi:MAG: COX15/CtaA family protein [Proteobacteria bacterium]|jgi:cytochrome c oxidase assembly protein subunit 15|nr:COX15/CtaA family protein [Pseudomonadota bacterium]